jgi:hypothetical protein
VGEVVGSWSADESGANSQAFLGDRLPAALVRGSPARGMEGAYQAKGARLRKRNDGVFEMRAFVIVSMSVGPSDPFLDSWSTSSGTGGCARGSTGFKD